MMAIIGKNEGYIKNMEVVAFHDCDKHYLFQTQLYKTEDGRYILYGGCFMGTGIEIIDVTDPANPKTIQYMDVMDTSIYPYMSTPKVQVCDDLLIVANGNCLPFLHGPAPENYTPAPGGVHIFSLKEDPEHPKKLSFWATGDDGPAAGVHRFTYNGGRYLHLAASAPGFTGYIYRIVDISDPEHPVEAGRWWNPGQFLGNQTKATQEKEIHGWNGNDTYPGYVHYPYVDTDNNLAYLSCVGAGFKILDVSDPAVPKVLGEMPMTHKPWIEDRSDRIYDCYFHAGMRVYDVSDPYVPKEIAYFIPPNPEELCFELEMANKPFGTSEDCVVDDRGYIYMNTMHDGLYILRCLV